MDLSDYETVIDDWIAEARQLQREVKKLERDRANFEEVYKALLPFAKAYKDSTEKGERWYGALDRLSAADFQVALKAVLDCHRLDNDHN